MRRLPVTSLVLLPVVVAQGVALGYLNPGFAYPVNDDWFWIEAARQLLHQGRLVIPDYAAMTLVGHTAYGALWCLPAGFSFAALHGATASLWIAAAVGTCWLLRELDVRPFWSAVGAGLVVFNPVTTCLALGFMTDVPFLAVSTLALAAYARATNRRAAGWAWVGAGLATWAILIRQIGLVIPVAAGISWLARPSDQRPRTWLAAVGLPLAAGGLFLVWYFGVHGPTLQWRATTLVGLPEALWQVPARAFIILMYAGLFISPLALASLTIVSKRLWGLSGAAVGAAMIAAYGGWGLRLPYVGNYLNGPGLGPYTLRDIGLAGYDHPLAWPKAVWFVLNGLAWIGAAWIIGTWLTWRRPAGPDRRAWADARRLLARPEAVLLLAAGLLVAAFCLMHVIYDRYLILLIVPASLAGLRRPAGDRARGVVCVVLLALMAAAGVLGTRTYLTWQAARAELARRPMSFPDWPARPEQIDGGLEFGLEYLYEKRKHAPSPPPGASCPWIVDDEYVVSFTPLAGYRVIAHQAVEAPLARRPAVMRLLRREATATGPTTK